jgi:hypothetical protein
MVLNFHNKSDQIRLLSAFSVVQTRSFLIFLARNLNPIAAGLFRVPGPQIFGSMTSLMETEDKDGAAQAGPKGSTSGLNISLHPLVIINISDHATRKKALSGGRPQRVLGILLGIQVASRDNFQYPSSINLFSLNNLCGARFLQCFNPSCCILIAGRSKC